MTKKVYLVNDFMLDGTPCQYTTLDTPNFGVFDKRTFEPYSFDESEMVVVKNSDGTVSGKVPAWWAFYHQVDVNSAIISSYGDWRCCGKHNSGSSHIMRDVEDNRFNQGA